MKGLFAFIFMAILPTAVIFAQDYDVRNLKWGMGTDEVQSTENLGTDLTRTDMVFGVKSELQFGFGSEGLESVSCFTLDRSFPVKAKIALKKKYGEPITDLDYSFLMDNLELILKFPDVSVRLFEGNNKIEKESGQDIGAEEMNLLRNMFQKRNCWEYGNSVVMLITRQNGTNLVYRPRILHKQSRQRFFEIPEFENRIK